MPRAEASDRQAGAARPAAHQAREARSWRSGRPADPAIRAGRGRSRPAGRRSRARLSARAVRCFGSGGGSGLRRGPAGASGGRWPCALDRAAGRSVRAGARRPGVAARTPDRGAGGSPRRTALGARGSAAQPGPHGGAGRGRSPDPDPEPAAAARRRSQRRDRLSAASAGGVRCAKRGPDRRPKRGDDQVADHAASGCRNARCVAASVGAAALAGRAGPLPRRPHRRLGDRLARGRFP